SLAPTISLLPKRSLAFARFAALPLGSVVRQVQLADAIGAQATFKSLETSSLPGGQCEMFLHAVGEAAQSILEEYRRPAGCLEQGSIKCAFSLPLFLRDTTARLTPAVAPADEGHDRCTRIFGHTFDGITPVPQPSRATIDAFDAYLVE